MSGSRPNGPLPLTDSPITKIGFAVRQFESNLLHPILFRQDAFQEADNLTSQAPQFHRPRSFPGPNRQAFEERGPTARKRTIPLHYFPRLAHIAGSSVSRVIPNPQIRSRGRAQKYRPYLLRPRINRPKAPSPFVTP